MLTVSASTQRSQVRNRAEARERMAALLREALAPPPPRDGKQSRRGARRDAVSKRKAALGTQVHATAAPNSLVRTIRVHILTLTDLVRVTATLRQLGRVNPLDFREDFVFCHIQVVLGLQPEPELRAHLEKLR